LTAHDPYTRTPNCFLHNTTLGLTKELVRITCEYLKEQDKEYYKRTKRKRKRFKKIDGIIEQVQSEFRRFHCTDVRLRPIMGQNGKKCPWEGNECRSFHHIALIVLVRLEGIETEILHIWHHFLSYVSTFHKYETTLKKMKKGILHFRKAKMAIQNLKGNY